MEGFGAGVVVFFLSKLAGYTGAVFSSLGEQFAPLARALVALYIVINGYRLMYGRMKGPDAVREMFVSMVLVTVLHGTLVESGFYLSLSKDVVGTALDLMAFFVGFGYGGDNLFAEVDGTMTTVMGAVGQLSPTGNFLSDTWVQLRVGLAAAILGITYTVVYLLFLALVLIGFASTYVMMVVGPIPIFLASFKETRFVFWAWVRATANYALFPVFVAVVMALCMYGIEDAAQQLSTVNVAAEGVFNAKYFGALFWAALTIYLMVKAPEFSAALTGGASSNMGGIAGGVSLVSSNIWAGTGGAFMGRMQQIGAEKAAQGMGWAGGQLKEGVGRAYSRMKGIIK